MSEDKSVSSSGRRNAVQVGARQLDGVNRWSHDLRGGNGAEVGVPLLNHRCGSREILRAISHFMADYSMCDRLNHRMETSGPTWPGVIVDDEISM